MTAARWPGVACAVGLCACVVAANWATTRYGFIDVGFGLTATAGTLVAGLALALRDGIEDALGRLATLLTIAAGTVLSYIVADPAIALASATAFVVAELADLAVYAPLRRRGRFGGGWWLAAVAVSGLIGAVVDTVVFLSLAFGFAAVGPALAGQLVGKAWANLGYIAAGKGVAVCSTSRTRAAVPQWQTP
jgi:uncharacterized PurR-regulated membrane protein YhhQ (DUF165 family)